MQVTDDINIDNSELDFRFIRASGPGGQHVNKSATAVQLRFNVVNSHSLPARVRRRLIKQAGNQITKDGVLIIEAAQHRSQHQNREEAINRLKRMIRRAAKEPKTRRETRPPQWSKRARLDNKRRRSEKKQLRESPQRW
jgi:ribosome-associated protein